MSDFIDKIKFSQKTIEASKKLLEEATPYSNKEKYAKKQIEKHEKLLKKYEKMRKAATRYN